MNDRATTAAGIFLTHELSPRVQRHFQRLVDETGPLVEWHLVYNEGNRPYPSTTIPYADPATVMPRRFGHSNAVGMIEGGYLDVMIIPLVMAVAAPHVWVMEYDVDFSGSWSDLFCQFRDVDADLLATSLRYRAELPHWGWWPHCQAPPSVDDSDYVRGFIPMMRLSRSASSTMAR